MVVARKIAYNVLISSVSKFLSTALALVSIGFITRYLGKEGFGNYATVLAFLSFFSAIADLGLNQLSAREISRPKADESEIIGNIFTLRVFVSLTVFFISPLIIFFLPYPQEVRYGIIIIVASFIFSSGYQVLNGIFQKHLAMDKVAISEFLGKAVQLFFIILAVKFRLGFSFVVSALLFSMIVNFLLVHLWLKKFIKIKFRFDFSYWKNFLKESYPVGISAVITFMYFKMDTIILSIQKSSADVGIYNAAYKVLENISFFPAMIIGLIFPIMSFNIFSNKERFRDISNKTFRVFCILVAPLLVGTLFLSEGIINLIGGSGFSESALVLRILVFSLSAIFFGNFFNAIMIAGNFQKKLVSVFILAAIFNISSNLIFIPLFSYKAAAINSVITEFSVVFFSGYLVSRKIGYFPKMEKIWRIVVSGIIMAIFLFIFGNLNFYLAGIGSVIVYVAALWLFKGIETEDLTSIFSQKNKAVSEL